MKNRALYGKTLFITGASRGIGLAIAHRAAEDGANIAVAAKTDKPHPKLRGTIHSAADDIRALGGKALPLVCDVRSAEQVQAAIAATVAEFGGIDIVVNNASAIFLDDTESLDPKRYQLMQQVNVWGTMFTTQAAIPHLRKSSNPHVLTMSPPLTHMEKWLGAYPAYASSKYGMSMLTRGFATELGKFGIAVNSLWPEFLIATAAVENFPGGAELMQRSFRPRMVAEAAYEILRAKSRDCNGNFFVDTKVLASVGNCDFAYWAVDPSKEPQRDIFLD